VCVADGVGILSTEKVGVELRASGACRSFSQPVP